MNKCIERCQTMYSQYKDEIEALVCADSNELKDLLRNGIIDYLCIMMRLKYVRMHAPKKSNSYQKLVDDMWHQFFQNEKDELENIQYDLGDNSRIHKMVKKSFDQWKIDIGWFDLDIMDINSNFADK